MFANRAGDASKLAQLMGNAELERELDARVLSMVLAEVERRERRARLRNDPVIREAMFERYPVLRDVVGRREERLRDPAWVSRIDAS